MRHEILCCVRIWNSLLSDTTEYLTEKIITAKGLQGEVTRGNEKESQNTPLMEEAHLKPIIWKIDVSTNKKTNCAYLLNYLSYSCYIKRERKRCRKWKILNFWLKVKWNQYMIRKPWAKCSVYWFIVWNNTRPCEMNKDFSRLWNMAFRYSICLQNSCVDCVDRCVER